MRCSLIAICVVLLGLGAGAPGAAGDERRFVPATRSEGDRVVLPVEFTDGTRAELVYPRRLRLAELGVVPYSSGTLQGESPAPGRADQVGRDFSIRYGDVDDFTGAWQQLGNYTGADGRQVGFWDSGPGESSNYLGFQFGSWAVFVYDYPPEFDGGAASMTDAERASWARSFWGRETAAGFLRLDGVGPLRLAVAGEHAGPQLAFGGMAGPLTLTSGRCRRTFDHDRRMHGRWVSWDRRYASWCASRSMRADARGSRRFMRAVIRSLVVHPSDRCANIRSCAGMGRQLRQTRRAGSRDSPIRR
jgi:hypothetical protein